MYTEFNFRSKKALKEAVASGVPVETFAPGLGGKRDGAITLEGPHYPAPHSWYATAVVKNGIIVVGSVK